MCNTKLCQTCGLYINQRPLFDIGKESKVFWVGLSAVQFDNESIARPLSPATHSGALIEKIEAPFKESISFYRTNLVKCLPLKNNKIRYPVHHEMEKCYINFQWELEAFNPSIVFLLGKQVASFVLKKAGIVDFELNDRFQFQQFLADEILFIPIQHPSYILVYKRKLLDDYIQGVQALFPGRPKLARKRA